MRGCQSDDDSDESYVEEEEGEEEEEEEEEESSSSKESQERKDRRSLHGKSKDVRGSKKVTENRIAKPHHSGFASADDAPAEHEDLDKGDADDGNNSDNGGKPKRVSGKRDATGGDARKEVPSGKGKCH